MKGKLEKIFNQESRNLIFDLFGEPKRSDKKGEELKSVLKNGVIRDLENLIKNPLNALLEQPFLGESTTFVNYLLKNPETKSILRSYDFKNWRKIKQSESEKESKFIASLLFGKKPKINLINNSLEKLAGKEIDHEKMPNLEIELDKNEYTVTNFMNKIRGLVNAKQCEILEKENNELVHINQIPTQFLNKNMVKGNGKWTTFNSFTD